MDDRRLPQGKVFRWTTVPGQALWSGTRSNRRVQLPAVGDVDDQAACRSRAVEIEHTGGKEGGSNDPPSNGVVVSAGDDQAEAVDAVVVGGASRMATRTLLGRPGRGRLG